MNSHTVITATSIHLVLEVTCREFKDWNLAALRKRQSVSDWILETLDASTQLMPTKFSAEEFPVVEGTDACNRLIFDFKNFSDPLFERLKSAAVRAVYPPMLLARVTGSRRKQSRYAGTLLVGSWSHVTLNRAANEEGAKLPANVTLFPTRILD